MPEIKFSEEEYLFVKKELESLLEKKVIVAVQHVAGEYISNIFCVDKKGTNKKRMILKLPTKVW